MSSWCPVCNSKVDTDGLERHVNDCLDASAAREIAVDEGDIAPDDDVALVVEPAKRARLTTDASTAKTSAVCGVCQQQIDVDVLFIVDECDHKFHRECLSKSVLDRVASDVRVLCPTAGCKTILSIRDVKQLLPKRSMIAPRGSSHVASARLMAELELIAAAEPEKGGYSVEVVDDNLYEWEIRFFNFDRSDGPLYDDIEKLRDKAIVMRAVFPAQFPFSPPFLRVLRPRFAYRTGHVTLGGSICTQLLTASGWSAFATLESVIVSIRANLVLGGARLAPGRHHDYTEAEAKESFLRTVREHQWE